jgi:hypothetical protein
MRFLPGSGRNPHRAGAPCKRANDDEKKVATPAQSSARDYGDRCSSRWPPAVLAAVGLLGAGA